MLGEVVQQAQRHCRLAVAGDAHLHPPHCRQLGQGLADAGAHTGVSYADVGDHVAQHGLQPRLGQTFGLRLPEQGVDLLVDGAFGRQKLRPVFAAEHGAGALQAFGGGGVVRVGGLHALGLQKNQRQQRQGEDQPGAEAQAGIGGEFRADTPPRLDSRGKEAHVVAPIAAPATTSSKVISNWPARRMGCIRTWSKSGWASKARVYSTGSRSASSTRKRSCRCW